MYVPNTNFLDANVVRRISNGILLLKKKNTIHSSVYSGKELTIMLCYDLEKSFWKHERIPWTQTFQNPFEVIEPSEKPTTIRHRDIFSKKGKIYLISIISAAVTSRQHISHKLPKCTRNKIATVIELWYVKRKKLL